MRHSAPRWVSACTFVLFLAIAGAGCQTLPLPPVNIAEAGWNLRQGQAIWRPTRNKPEIVGEITVARRPESNRAFIEFTKTPFPILTAQLAEESWEINFVPERRSFHGKGEPPPRLIWLWVPVVLAGTPPPKNWSFRQLDPDHWQLENSQTGESLEGFWQ